MLRFAPVPRAALLVSHSYCISRNIWVRRRAIGVGHSDSVACAGQRAVGAGRVTAVTTRQIRDTRRARIWGPSAEGNEPTRWQGTEHPTYTQYNQQKY